MQPRPPDGPSKTEFALAYDKPATKYAEAVLEWAKLHNLRIRNGGDVCSAADAYETERTA